METANSGIFHHEKCKEDCLNLPEQEPKIVAAAVDES